MESTTRKIVLYTGGALILIWTIVPVYWLINMSLTHQKEILDARLVPKNPTICNYARLLDDDAKCNSLDNKPYQASAKRRKSGADS